MKIEMTQNPLLKKFESYSGWVSGDLHFLNFGLFRSNENRWRTGLIDLDDCGKAPFAFEFLRTTIGVDSFKISIPFSSKLKLYKSGLSGEKPKKPDFLIKLEEQNESLADLRKKSLKKFIDKDTGLFKPPKNSDFIVLELHQLTASQKEWVEQSLNALKSHEPKIKVLKYQIRKKTTGGSQGLLRNITHIEVNGVQKIIEIKEMSESPSISEFGPQKYSVEGFKQTSQLYREVDSSDFYNQTQISNKWFTIRERIEPDNEIETQNYRELAHYLIQWQGYMHGKQLSLSEVKQFSELLDGAQSELQILAEKYIKILENSIEKN